MRILAIRYSGLGDIIMLLQTLEKVKIKYNASSITLLTDLSNKDIAPLTNGLINDIIPINRKCFKEKKVLASLKEIYYLFKNIRKKFDMCIDFQNFGETATISYLVNAKIKIGAPKNQKYNYGYTDIIKKDDFKHRSQLFSRIAKVNDTLDFSKLYLNQEAKEYQEYTKNKLEITKKTVGLNIGSTNENRRWNEKNFNTLANILKDNYNVVLFLGPLEIKYRNAFDKERLLIVEDVNLIKLCGAISVCNYFITNDTGPAHLAAALKIPVLTLFSTGEDSNVGVLTNKKEFIKNLDINKITVKEVIERLNNLI
jgi:ADP-heptose:LPS heptosyltransferase